MQPVPIAHETKLMMEQSLRAQNRPADSGPIQDVLSPLLMQLDSDEPVVLYYQIEQSLTAASMRAEVGYGSDWLLRKRAREAEIQTRRIHARTTVTGLVRKFLRAS
ncbi:MAG: hypothetical protein JWN38_213 [Candidatus Saccharibacteria bacterium]|nr:hypothetical protein [Candidatus Saccharibacteria bacterium]